MSEQEVVEKMPLWARVILKIQTVVLFLFTGALILQFLLWLFDSYRWYREHYIVLGLFSLFILFLTLYTVAVFKEKRWITPVIYAFTFASSTIFLWVILFGKVHDWVGASIAILSSLFIFSTAYVVTVFKKSLKGSIRNLKIQIPLSLFLAPLLVPIFIFPFLAFIYTDIDPIDDSDLILPYVPILDEEDNAHYALIDFDTLSEKEQESVDQALDLYGLLEDEEDMDLQEGIHLVEETRFITDAFIAASKRKGYQCPTTVNSYTYDTGLCPLNDMRDTAELVTLRIYVEAKQGDTQSALEHGVATVKFGFMMDDSNSGKLIEHVVAVAISRIGLASLEKIDNSIKTVSAEMLFSASKTLLDSELGFKGLIQSHKGFYLDMKYAIVDGHTMLTDRYPRTVLSYIWHPNRTTSDFAELVREWIVSTNHACGMEQPHVPGMYEVMYKKRSGLYNYIFFVMPNSVGYYVESTTFASLTTARLKTCEADIQNQVLQEKLHTLAEEVKLREEAELEESAQEGGGEVTE